MKINCITCGHNFQLDEAYDDYTGPVRCWVCGALMEIKTEAGNLRRMEGWKSSTEPTVEPTQTAASNTRKASNQPRRSSNRKRTATTSSEG